MTRFNGHYVMVDKVKGEFKWHDHDNTDDFFLVLSGRITIRLRDGDVELGPAEQSSFRSVLSINLSRSRKPKFS